MSLKMEDTSDMSLPQLRIVIKSPRLGLELLSQLWMMSNSCNNNFKKKHKLVREGGTLCIGSFYWKEA